MAIFRTPTENVVAVLPVDENELSSEEKLAQRLARHVAPSARGINVFLLTDGNYVERQPGDMDTVAKTYYGGHDIEVSATEVASLTAAGYGAYIEA
jgi:hypothetical protein